MKKFFTLVAAAIVSVAMFASREVVPSDADLASYATKTYTMCIYNESACNDIVLIGTYVGWNKDADLLKFQAVEGFEGWYVVSWDDATDPEDPEVIQNGGIQAKPVQLDGSGLFNWDYQLGADAELIRGTADLLPGNTNEVDIKNIGAGIVVIDVKSWKNNPCTAVYHVYNVALVSPDCNDEDFITPAISGGFNGWAQQAMEMNELKTAERQNAGLPGAVFEISFKAAEGSEFKFRSAEEWGKEWTNELKEYDAENDGWKGFSGAGIVEASGNNLLLGETTDLFFDLGDPELYSWTNCEKPSAAEYVVIGVNVPANAPAAGVEIIGTFDSWGGTAMELLNTGWYFVELDAAATDQFKFREAGTWDNEIVYVNKITEEGKPVGLDNITFKDVWKEDTYKGTPCKFVELDYSDPEVYVWKANWVAPSGVEDIVLTEKAQKVVVDGVLYIVRDNKLFNVGGAQVR
jgi:hypothetical protein